MAIGQELVEGVEPAAQALDVDKNVWREVNWAPCYYSGERLTLPVRVFL